MSDGADTHLLLANTQMLHTHNSLARKRLIDLEEIDILQGQTGKVEDLGNSIGRSDTHNLGRDSSNGGGTEFAEHRETKTFGD